MYKFVLFAVVCSAVVASARPASLKFDLSKFDPSNVDCKSNIDVIDECGLQQGFSHIFDEFAYPTNHTSLLSSCKRQSDALKCLRAYSKCLQPLSKQVLIAMVNSRQKYNKKICAEKQSEAATKLIDLTQCMLANNPNHEKAVSAEISSITIPESIVNSKLESVQDRLKHSCCSVAKVRRDYMDATVPNCKQHSQAASELIDSYLAETVGIICPDFSESKRDDCAKLPKLTAQKSANARSFIRPIVNVIQTLA